MAGDWIKLCCDTPDKPEVYAIATELDIDPDAALGKLTRIWIWFQAHTENGCASRATLAQLDRIASATGFGAAMQKVDWLTVDGSGIVMPHFDYHNGKPAKTRSLAAIRMAKKRCASSATKAQPEKRREEKRDSTTVESSAKKKPRPPDPIWDAIAAIFYPSGVAKSQATRVGKVVRDLKELHATPEQVRERYAAARRAWTDVAVFGPEALVKNWDGLGGRLPAGGTAKSEKTLALEAMWAREAAERKADEERVKAERAKKLPSP